MSVRKLLTGVSIKLFFLLGGIEYAVILPTLWDYLRLHFGASKWFYGLTLSAFSMANLLVGPIFGMVFDSTHRTKLIVLFANLFEIGGNFMYFAAQSKYMVLGSRFLVGIGAGAEAALLGEISRTTLQKERTLVFSITIAIGQIGLIVGPGLNLFLRQLDYKIGPFVLDKYTSPGALMVIIWTVLQIWFLLFFFNLPSVDDFVKSQYEQHLEHSHQPQPAGNSDLKHEADGQCVNVNQNIEDQASISASTISGQEKMPLLSNAGVKESQKRHQNVTSSHQNFLQKAYWVLVEFLRQELIYLLAVFFVVIFNQTSIETMVVPMLEDLLGWTEFGTSLFFCGAGVELLVSFALLMLLSKKVTDRWLLLFGLVLQLAGYIWLLVLAAGANPRTPWIHAKVLSGSAICIFGLPFLFVPTDSLYSKLLPKHVQGFGQGLQQSTSSIAAILGPLWAGASLHQYHLLLAVPLGILTGLMVLTLDSFSRIKVLTKDLSDSKT